MFGNPKISGTRALIHKKPTAPAGVKKWTRWWSKRWRKEEGKRYGHQACVVPEKTNFEGEDGQEKQIPEQLATGLTTWGGGGGSKDVAALLGAFPL